MSKKSRQERRLAMQEMEKTMDAASIEKLEAEAEAEKIDFDGWWASRASKIPPQHHKEIIKADFRGRGLSTMETMEDFDDAIREYGLKL